MRIDTRQRPGTGQRLRPLLATLALAAVLQASAEANETSGEERQATKAAPDLAAELWRADPTAPRACPGAYLGSEQTLAATPPDPAAPVELSAGELNRVTGRTTAYDGVVLRQGERTIRTDKLDSDDAGRTTTAALRIEQPGLQVVGGRATLDLAGDQGSIEDSQFVLTGIGLRGTAARVDYDRGRLRLDDVMFTRCPPGNRTWLLRAKEVRVDRTQPDKTVTAIRHVRLTMGPVPVLYVPYMRLPSRGGRSSGLLRPSFGSDDDNGTDITLPYYLNLAPNYDATLGARWLGERGAGAELEFRHLARRARNHVAGAYLPADDVYNGELSLEDFLAAGGEREAFVSADRWLVEASHRGRQVWPDLPGGGHSLATRVDFQAASDNDYFVDLGSSNISVDSRASLHRHAELHYLRGGFDARLWAQGFQRLEPGPESYRRLPELNLGYAGRLAGPLRFRLDTALSRFDRPGADGGEPFVVGERAHVEPRLRLGLSRQWGFLALGAGSRHTGYRLDHTGPGVEARPRRHVRLASADGGLFFERHLGGRWLQTLEPRLRYFYQSYADQSALPVFDATPLTLRYRQLFADNRFAGVDRIADANQLAVGIGTRLVDSATGAERFAARVGALAHLRAPRTQFEDARLGAEWLADTPLVGEVETGFGRLRARATAVWDIDNDDVDEVGFALSYRDPGRPGGRPRLVNVSHQRRALSGAEQTEVSLHWPVGARWSAFALWHYDWRLGRRLERFAGFGYGNCCLEAKLLYYQRVDVPRNRIALFEDAERLPEKRGIALQVVLRGLTGFGTRVESRLERGIRGYRRSPAVASPLGL